MMTNTLRCATFFLLSLLLIEAPALARIQQEVHGLGVIDRAQTELLKKRIAGAQAIFVGIVTNRVEAGDWVTAELKVEEAILGPKAGESVEVTWRRYVGGKEIYNANEGDVGVAILDAKRKDRYWLRADKFESAALTNAIIGLLRNAQAAAAQKELRVATIFGDGMVLQQQTDASIWGRAAAGAKISIEPSWQKTAVETAADADGKWKTAIKTPKAGGPFTLAVSSGQQKKVFKNVLSGEVWICSGQSNMQWKMRGFGKDHWADEIKRANHPQIRLCQVQQALSFEAQQDVKSNWSVCTPNSATNFSAIGYFFGEQLDRELKVPIGLISTNWGGSSAEAWIDQDTIAKQFPEFAKVTATYPQLIKEHGAEPPSGKGINQRMPSLIYNKMIHPLVPYSFRGVIWYQGESNIKNPVQYRKLFPALIENWRQQWGQGDFPFYFVQIAPFKYSREPYPAAMLREAQLQTLSVPNTGMAVTMDVGDPTNIHPKRKKPVADRLARLALARTYGRSEIVDSGPQYVGIEVESNKIRIKFKDIGSGLSTSDNKPLSHFEVAGKDRVFHPAVASVDGETILASSEKVSSPVAIRFAWGNADQPNLINKEGLPCSSFRSDDWEIKPKKK